MKDSYVLIIYGFYVECRRVRFVAVLKRGLFEMFFSTWEMIERMLSKPILVKNTTFMINENEIGEV